VTKHDLHRHYSLSSTPLLCRFTWCVTPFWTHFSCNR